MSFCRRLAFAAWCLTALIGPAPAASQGLSGLARVLPDSAIVDNGEGVEIGLGLSQAVPYRIFQLADPWRVVVDFNEIDWSLGEVAGLDRSDRVVNLRAGVFQPGWSRLVLELDGPYGLALAELSDRGAGGAALQMWLDPVSEEDFAARSGAPEGAGLLPEGASFSAPVAMAAGSGKPMVVLDPGHGGIDPGAQVDGEVEARLTLTFARELKETLIRTGVFQVALTRDGDYFVPLETRISIAHALEADVFISLHADALPDGRASGATIYTLSPDASDIASRMLAERHDREELLAGVDLSRHDDEIAIVLMDMARTETAHETAKLATALVNGLDSHIELYKNPHLSAGFSVLKSPDIPSVLIELGFLSQEHDRRNLTSAAWRQSAAQGVAEGLGRWVEEIGAERGLRLR